MADQPEAFAILSPKESIGAAIASSAAPHSEEFGDLRAFGTFEELGGDIATRDQHYLGQVGVFLEE